MQIGILSYFIIARPTRSLKNRPNFFYAHNLLFGMKMYANQNKDYSNDTQSKIKYLCVFI